MQALRNSRLTARLVLAWFALFVAASVAAPLVNPTTIQTLCSAGGMKTVVIDDGGSEVKVRGGMDCPLCAPIAGAPPDLHITFAAPASLAFDPIATPTPHSRGTAGAPLPARGPPSLV